jgi:lipoprotein signal peptidase
VAEKVKKPLINLIVIFVITVAADQGIKQWAYHHLLTDNFHAETENYPVCGSPKEEMLRARFVRQNDDTKNIVRNFFNLRYVENCASAFGLMKSVPEKLRFPFFLIISILACIVIPYMYIKTPADQRLMLYALPFVLGGALGNLLDRMIYRFVIDFVDWYVVIGGKDYHWPTFNIADVAIVIGIALMLLQMIPAGKDRKSESSE